MTRNSYSDLMRQPVWYLTVGEKLKATTRAKNIDEAIAVFEEAGLMEATCAVGDKRYPPCYSIEQ